MRLLGYSLIRFRGRSMGRALPDGSLALFRRRPKIERDDIVLVRHPEYGTFVRRVAAVSRKGRYALRGSKLSDDRKKRPDFVEGQHIDGVLVMQVRLPRALRRD